ncbi:phage tail protein, partial [Acinetobacter baumannii]
MSMLITLGQFAFGIDTLAFDKLVRSSTWRHPSNSRVGARPARQSLGPGDETLGLTGVLAP